MAATIELEPTTDNKLVRLSQIVNRLWYYKLVSIWVREGVKVAFNPDLNWVPVRASKYKAPKDTAVSYKDAEEILILNGFLDQDSKLGTLV